MGEQHAQKKESWSFTQESCKGAERQYTLNKKSNQGSRKKQRKIDDHVESSWENGEKLY
jgi:hypothetical protein